MISENNFIKLDVEGLLDLDKLSRQYHIPKDELIQFHNCNCAISDILPLHMPKYVPHIYIPKINYDSKNSRSLPNSSLKYPLAKSKKNYGVIIKYLHSDLQVHFEVSVDRDGSSVIINKKKTYVNNAEVGNLIEKLYQEAEKAIYPLNVTVDGNGSFAKIENDMEILHRWESHIFPKLKEYYVGQTAEDILKKMNSVFQNLNSKKAFFLQSVFYRLFFLPIYQTYSNYQKDGFAEFYFAYANRSVSYDVKYELVREYSRGNKMVLQMTGKEQNDLFFDKTEKGTLEVTLKFQKDTHDLFSITGFASTYERGKELKIEFQLFDIGDLN